MPKHQNDKISNSSETLQFINVARDWQKLSIVNVISGIEMKFMAAKKMLKMYTYKVVSITHHHEINTIK